MISSRNFDSSIPQINFQYKIVDEEVETPMSHFEVSKEKVDVDLAFLKQALANQEQSSSLEETAQKIQFVKKTTGTGRQFRKREVDSFDANDVSESVGLEIIQKSNQKKRIKGTPVINPKSSAQTTFSSNEDFLKESTIVTNFASSCLTPSPSPLILEFKRDDLKNLRFSQRSIQACFGDSQTYLFSDPRDESALTLFDILRNEGWKAGVRNKIDAVLMPDGRYTSFDNRRLAVAKAINEHFSQSIVVPASSHRYSDKAPPGFMNRLTVVYDPIEGIEANTFGHAVTVRVAESVKSQLNSSEKYGFDRYPRVVTGLRGKNVREITFDKVDQKIVLK